MLSPRPCHLVKGDTETDKETDKEKEKVKEKEEEKVNLPGVNIKDGLET